MKSCREKFDALLMIARKCSALCGADIFNPDFHYNGNTYFTLVAIFTFFSLSGYTIYFGVYIDNDWTAIMKALCMVGSGVQGLTKFYSLSKNQNALRKIHKGLDEVYRTYEQKHIDYQNALNNSTRIISRVLKCAAVVYTVGSIIMLSVPVLYYLVFGKKILVMQFLIPGVDPFSRTGYLMTCAAHALCIVIGAFGNFAGDMFFFILSLHVPLFKNILKIKFEDLNKVLLATDDSTGTMQMVVDILIWHQEYSAYTQTLSEVYFGVLFVQIFTTAFSIGMTTFIAFITDWPGGYAYLVYSFIVLYAYCGLGTVTEISNDDVCDYVYNVCLWYRLPIGERKMLMIMLMKAQNPTLLTVGDIMPLSVTTGLSLTKTIYSFLMMLFNFTED